MWPPLSGPQDVFILLGTFRRLPAPPQPQASWCPSLHWQRCGSQGPDGQDTLGVTGLVISEADPTSNSEVRKPGLTAFSDPGLPGELHKPLTPSGCLLTAQRLLHARLWNFIP
ncbi:unnamed protein product [Rangifer tarandus platyrhynchus]|uniref:Uncharacterized protein n=2 Tax=Rangifer tarandus platyrhynchus TaxID=3082113 RepID=A0ACB0DWR8_RANTA|nr:unnamed protein product [Rangifer tarandus platyrhynchus]CAI9692714.1 unnamed protein product [Rangifer tarandus platyrhynchus]